MWGRATRSLYPIYVKKQPIRLAVFTKMRIFAVALSYGVMVAQQVLVLFVVVRIRLGQRLRRLYRLLFCFLLLSGKTKNVIVGLSCSGKRQSRAQPVIDHIISFTGQQ